MAKAALNTYLEPQQKASLERIARQRGVSQAHLVREAIEEYVSRHDTGRPSVTEAEAWEIITGGVYDGDGRPNDHDDIYR